MSATPVAVVSSSIHSNVGPDEDDLRKKLREALQDVTRREPLETTYKYLLLTAVVTPRKPILPKDKLYKPITARLRERVEAFRSKTDHPWDRIAQREKMEEGAMRAAFTLREGKKHEQDALLKATLSALPRRHPDESGRKRFLEGMALGLQQKEIKRQKKESKDAAVAAEERKKQTEQERQRIEDQKRRNRESARRRQDEEERAEEDDRRRHDRMESPARALQKYTIPLYKKLWDMEFANLGNTNPFRIVIDRSNHVTMGVPDYFDVIDKPMNLTYIMNKVESAEYDTLQAFFADINLMVNNALLYNSDPNNDYHLAAKEMKRQFQKMAKTIVASLKKKQAQQQR
jgi:Bromodomain